MTSFSRLRFARGGVVGSALCLLATLCACRTLPPDTRAAAPASVAPASVAPGSAVPGSAARAATPSDAGVAVSQAHAETETLAPVVEGSASDIQQVVYDPPTLPPQAFTGGPGGAAGACPPEMGEAPEGHYGPWQPDALQGPWPYDEYLFDGGDRDVPVKVDRNWTVRGIDQEDTIAHYDTLQGRTEVTPSNRVPIYAPRFAAVRKVYGLELHEGHERVAGVENPVRLHSQESQRKATTALQQIPPVLEHNFRSTVALRDQTRGIGVENRQTLQGFDNHFLAYEDFLIIRRGQFDGNEKARLAERIQAALIWTTDQSVQVVIEGAPAYEAKGATQPGETLLYEMPPGKPRLRIVKVASKSEALPGEEIDFTLRFDNVGDQRIGNVTIIDSLTTRLEYVPESAQCDLPAQFGTVENEAESLLLRWEIRDPLDVGKGGVIRFKCKVR
ncbi:MAG: hypothetical protein U0935_01275 [Pirellulales bacterium]